MGPLSLTRQIKIEEMYSPQVTNEKVNTVKQEVVANNIKPEPKTEEINRPIQVKVISATPDIKPIESNIKNNNRKRRLNSSGLRPRRPQLSLAIRVHKSLMAKDPNTLTSKELDSLTWAESIIVQDILKRGKETLIKDVPAKIRNYVRENAEENSSKTEMKRNTVQNSLQLEIIDYGSPDRKYTIERGKLVEKALNKAVVDHILKKPGVTIPTYGLTSWRNGVLVLDCKDLISYDFARVTVNKMIPWRHAKLRAVPVKSDNVVYTGKFHVPEINIKKEDVLKVLESQNPRINMTNWKVIEEKVTNPGFKTYILAISQPPVKFLQNNYLRLFFGASELALEFIKNETTV